MHITTNDGGTTMEREALLICDMLNDFVREGAPLEVPETRRIIPAIQREIARARAAGNEIVYIVEQHATDDREFLRYGWPPHGIAGTDGAQIINELKPEPADTTVGKTTYSGFHGTKLDAFLKSRGIRRIRLTGCVTHICIYFTAYDATLLDYQVSVVRDAVAGLARENHDAALRMMRAVLNVEII